MTGIRCMVMRGGTSKGGAEKTAHVQGIDDDLRQKLGLKVEIKVMGKDRGQVVLRFQMRRAVNRNRRNIPVAVAVGR